MTRTQGLPFQDLRPADPLRRSYSEASRQGFSLVELMVVISITVTLTGLIVPKFGQFRHAQELNDETTKLQSALRSAQLNAVNGIKCDNNLPSKNWNLTFDNNKTSYTVAPECQAGGLSQPSKTYQIQNESVEINSILDNSCEIPTNKLSFENISAKVNFNLSEAGCERNASKVTINLKSVKASSERCVVINKGGSIEILNSSCLPPVPTSTPTN
ncbi:MAG: type II secretion system protein [Candidatus Daviesbacteria bacterium]|nr:type II secretion system protein [Candidatus Daviesbacteria bacterium]